MANKRLSNSNVYINSADIASYNVSSLTYPGQLGQFHNSDGKKFQLVKLDSSAVTAAAGHAVVWIDFDDFVVTNDISDAIGPNAVAGVLLGAVTAGNYGFIQVRGPYATVKTDGGDDISAGDVVYVDPSVDGAVDSTAAGTAPLYIPLGVATAADVDANDTVAIVINCPLNGE